MNGEQAAPPEAVPRNEHCRFLNTCWDVDRINAELDANTERIISARPENLVNGLLDMDIDPSVLDTLECPDRAIIVVGVQAGGRAHKFIADGNHRLTRALRDHQERIDVYYVPPEREGQFRM